MSAKPTLKDTTIVVVGASRGIGLGLAQHLHEAGARVIATARKPEEAASRLPKGVQLEQLDVTKEETVEAFAKKMDKIDTLIVNAAVGHDDKMKDTDASTLHWYLDSNVVGAHRAVKALLPALRKGTKKQIVLISSTSGSLEKQVGAKIGFMGPYAVTKAATNMLAVQYHNELHEEGFTVHPIHPGWVATDMGLENDVPADGPKPISVETSSKGIVEVVAQLTPEKSSTFYQYDGAKLPW